MTDFLNNFKEMAMESGLNLVNSERVNNPTQIIEVSEIDPLHEALHEIKVFYPAGNYLKQVLEEVQNDPGVEYSEIAFFERLSSKISKEQQADIVRLEIGLLAPINIVLNPVLINKIFTDDDARAASGRETALAKGRIYSAVNKGHGIPGNIVGSESGQLHKSVRDSIEKFISATEIADFTMNSIKDYFRIKLKDASVVEVNNEAFLEFLAQPEDLLPQFFRNSLVQLCGTGASDGVELQEIFNQFREQMHTVANATFTNLRLKNPILDKLLSFPLQHLPGLLKKDLRVNHTFFENLGNRIIEIALDSNEHNIVKYLYDQQFPIEYSDPETIRKIIISNISAYIEATYSTSATSASKIWHAIANNNQTYQDLNSNADNVQFTWESYRTQKIVAMIGRETKNNLLANIGIGPAEQLIFALTPSVHDERTFVNPSKIDLHRTHLEKNLRRLIFGQPQPSSEHLRQGADNRHCPGEGAMISSGVRALNYYKDSGITFLSIQESRPLKYEAVIFNPTPVQVRIPLGYLEQI